MTEYVPESLNVALDLRVLSSYVWIVVCCLDSLEAPWVEWLDPGFEFMKIK